MKSNWHLTGGLCGNSGGDYDQGIMEATKTSGGEKAISSKNCPRYFRYFSQDSVTIVRKNVMYCMLCCVIPYRDRAVL